MNETALPLRYAELRDAERIAAYHHECWLQAFAPLVSPEVMEMIEPRVARWESWLADDSGFTVVVVTDQADEPIGHTAVKGNELVHLFVDPTHHGNGLGGALLAIAERLIRQAGHDQAELHTIVGNAPAIGLYESHGWVVTNETVDEQLENGSSYTEHVLRKDVRDQNHVKANRDTWDDDASNWVERGRGSWARDPHWGEMGISDSTVNAMPDVAGRDVIELGCGTGYVSAWCVRAGAKNVVGLDNSIEQLSTAAILQGEFEMPFPLVWANAEQTPFADNSFDVAINEYGAAMWCDPYRWIPEAARLLRPGGTLVFLTWSTLLSMTAPPFEGQRTSTQLLRPQSDLHRVTFPDFDGVEFALSHGKWIELLRANDFVVDRLIELHAPDDGPERYSYYDASWAKQWPAEEVWCATYSGSAASTRSSATA